jgi:hypothetical protein
MERENEEGLAEIEYVARERGDGLMTVRRKDRLLAAAGKNDPQQVGTFSDPVICDQLKALSLTYFDDEGQERERWDSETATFGYATPAAIRIKIEMAGEKGSQPMETVVTLPARREKID